jgi:hypothetical protein
MEQVKAWTKPQLSMSKGERHGLRTRMAPESVSFVHADEKLSAFRELELLRRVQYRDRVCLTSS